MKKSNIALILVVATVAMASCTKDEVLVDNQRQNAYRIQFGEAFPDNEDITFSLIETYVRNTRKENEDNQK